MKLEKIKKKKVQIGILIAMMLVVTSVGTYAYIKMEAIQDSTNNIATLCLDLHFEEDTDSAINLQDAFPLTEKEGKRLAPYKFTITNTCSSIADYQVQLDILSDLTDPNTLALEHIRTNFGEEDSMLLSSLDDTTVVAEGATTSKILTTGELRKDASITYEFRLWIDEKTTVDEGANKNFASKIVVIGSSRKQASAGDLQLAVYIDNVSSPSIPERGAYTVNVDCKGNGNGFWDYNNWGAVVTGFTSGAVCDVDFTSGKYMSDYIIDASKTDNTIVPLTQSDTTQTGNYATKEYRYSGKMVNNWVCFGSEEATCPDDNLYRIIGVFPTQNMSGGAYENRVKLIKNAYYTESTSGYLKSHSNAPGESGYLWHTSARNTWESSTLQNYVLNTVYWNSLGDYQKYIDTTLWYLGAPNYNSYSTYTSAQLYQIERSTTAGKSGGATSYKAYIGLMYPSDYGYSIDKTYWDEAIYTNREKYVAGKGWLYATGGKNEWFISPESSYSDGNGVPAWNVHPDGHVYASIVSLYLDVFGVRPSFNLDSEVMYKSGTGTSSDPYRIKIEI